jgi:hypothetical protein
MSTAQSLDVPVAIDMKPLLAALSDNTQPQAHFITGARCGSTENPAH